MKKYYSLLVGVWAVIAIVVFAIVWGINYNDNKTKDERVEQEQKKLETETETEPEYEDPYLMEQLSDAVFSGDDAKVRELAEQVKELYPDTPDSVMADAYLDIINEKQKNKEQEYESIDFKQYIQLYSVKTSSPNSAGGIDLYIRWKNTSAKTVKYAWFKCVLYNAVDDIVADEIRNSYSFTGKVTGPINPGENHGDNVYWDCAWYNNSGKYAKITEIQIEYMDGTEITIPEGKIDGLY